MFWTHKPKAFNRENEKSAFLNSVLFGVKSKLFTVEEVIDAIIESNTDTITSNCLIEAIGKFK